MCLSSCSINFPFIACADGVASKCAKENVLDVQGKLTEMQLSDETVTHCCPDSDNSDHLRLLPGGTMGDTETL